MTDGRRTSGSALRRIACVGVGAAAVLVVVAVAGVIAMQPRGARSMERRRTAWDAIASGVSEDGAVAPATALSAFALAYGIAGPGGSPAPAVDGSVPFCGTMAVRWARAAWPSLSTDERTRIEAALGSSREHARVGSPWGASIAYAQTIDEAGLRALVATIETRIAANVGRPLGKPVVVEVVASDGLHDDAPSWSSFGDAPTRSWAETVLAPAGRGPGDARDCRLRFGRRALRVDERTRVSAIAHELFHCFQHAAFTGTTTEWLDLRSRASWMIEGAAAWAGESIAGSSTRAASDAWWWSYFDVDPRGRWALGSKSFEAIGLFAHLEAQGTSSWSDVLSIVNLDPEAAYGRLMGGRAGALSSWASGTMLREGWGSAWNLGGTIVRRSAGPRNPLSLRAMVGRDEPATGGSPLRLETSPRTTTVVEVDLAGAGDVVRIDALGWGRARLAADGASEVSWPGDDAPMTERPASVARFVCRADRRCACPDGRVLGAGSGRAARDARLLVAIAGGASQVSSVELRSTTLGDACRETASAARPVDERDVCLLGTWTLDLEHTRVALAETAGGTIRAMSGSYTMRFDASGAANATLARYGVTTAGAGGIASTSESDGTTRWRWATTIDTYAGRGPSRGTLRLTEGTSDVRVSATVSVGGRTMRVPVPNGDRGAAGATSLTAQYECGAAVLTLDHAPPAIDQRFTR